MAKEMAKQRDEDHQQAKSPLSPFDEMDQWMNDFFPRRWMQRWGWPSMGELGRAMEGYSPRVDLIDRENEVVLRAEIPGEKKEDLDISITENAVVIAGTTQRESKQETGEYYRREIARGGFSRAVTLPTSVDTEKAATLFEDGVLEITMPKTSKAKRRQIKLD